MSRTIVGVIRGGTSSEYNLSLKTGAAMMAALPEERYETRDIFIDKSGLWHLRGTPATPARALAQVDVVLNGLHGGVGEDGTVQRLLQRIGVPFAGSRALSSALALNKIRAREIVQRAGIKMPRALAFSLADRLNTGEMTQLAFAEFPPPYVVKPPSDGASHGIVIATTLHDLPNVLGDVLDQYGAALVEEFIRGRHASVGIIEKFRNEQLYALPPALVILPGGARMLEPKHHEEGTVRYAVPSDFTHEEKRSLMETARAAHRALDLAHFSRADLIVAPPSFAPDFAKATTGKKASEGNARTYLLEVNTNPGLYAGASFPLMLESVGSSVGEFLEHAIALARN